MPRFWDSTFWRSANAIPVTAWGLPRRGPAFLEKPGEKHQGLPPLDPDVIFMRPGGDVGAAFGEVGGSHRAVVGQAKSPTPQRKAGRSLYFYGWFHAIYDAKNKRALQYRISLIDVLCKGITHHPNIYISSTQAL